MTETFNTQDKAESKRINICWREAVDSFTDVQKLAQYAKDPSPLIRSTVAENCATAIETLEELSHDDNPDVASAAQKNLEWHKAHPEAPKFEP